MNYLQQNGKADRLKSSEINILKPNLQCYMKIKGISMTKKNIIIIIKKNREHLTLKIKNTVKIL